MNLADVFAAAAANPRDEYVTPPVTPVPPMPLQGNSPAYRGPLGPEGALLRQAAENEINATLNRPPQMFKSESALGDLFAAFAGASDRYATGSMPNAIRGLVDLVSPDNLPTSPIGHIANAGADWFEGASNGSYDKSDYYNTLPPGHPYRGMVDTFEAVPAFAAGLATPGGPTAKALGMVAPVFGDKYEETGDPVRAGLTAASVMALEKAGLDKVLGKGSLGSKAASEIATESLEPFAEGAIDSGLYGEQFDLGSIGQQIEGSAIPAGLLGASGKLGEIDAGDAGRRLMTDAQKLGTILKTGADSLVPRPMGVTPEGIQMPVPRETPDIPQNSEMVIGARGGAKLPGGKENIDRAWEMREQGATPKEVRDETGWYDEIDGVFAQEVSDIDAQLTENARQYAPGGGIERTTLPEVIDAETIFTAYPDMRDTTVRFVIDPDMPANRGRGEFNPRFATGLPDNHIEVIAPTLREARIILLHEMQHAVQSYEGMSPGASPEAKRFATKRPSRHAEAQQAAWDAGDTAVGADERSILEQDLANLEAEMKKAAETRGRGGPKMKAAVYSLGRSYNDVLRDMTDIKDRLRGNPPSPRMLDNYKQYRANPGEIMANETMYRADKTQAELAADPRYGVEPGPTLPMETGETSRMSAADKARFKARTGQHHADLNTGNEFHEDWLKGRSKAVGRDAPERMPDIPTKVADPAGAVKGTAVADKEGKPVKVYHATQGDFDSFDTTRSEMGSHFGTQDQMKAFERRDGTVDAGDSMGEFYLDIKNPLRLPDTGMFDAAIMYDLLHSLGIADFTEVEAATKEAKSTAEETKAVQELLKSKGYDGIVYLNRREGAGTEKVGEGDTDAYDAFEDINAMSDKDFLAEYPNAQDSYIVFDPEQVVSTTPTPVAQSASRTTDLINTEVWDTEIPGAQEFDSGDTSLNQVPAGFKVVRDKLGGWQEGTVNADIGGGRHEKHTQAMQEAGVENLVIDPVNRAADHNAKNIARVQGGQADTATSHNVLNVIAEPEIRARVIGQVVDALKPGGTGYITVYQGDGKGVGRETSKGYQNNMKTADYVSEVEAVAGPENVTRKGGVIMVNKPGEMSTPAAESKSVTAVKDSVTAVTDNTGVVQNYGTEPVNPRNGVSAFEHVTQPDAGMPEAGVPYKTMGSSQAKPWKMKKAGKKPRERAVKNAFDKTPVGGLAYFNMPEDLDKEADKDDYIKALRSQYGSYNVKELDDGTVVAVKPPKNLGVETRYLVDSGLPYKGKQPGTWQKAAVTKAFHPKNAEKVYQGLDMLAEKHPDPLASEEAWVAFENELSDSDQVFAPPYDMIKLANDMDGWVERHGQLSDKQLAAASEGFKTVDEFSKLYESGDADAVTTGQLMLWGMLSRMLSAHPHESAFLDAATSGDLVDIVQSAIDAEWTDADVDKYLEWSGGVIGEFSPGKSGTSNMNDFGKLFLKKMSAKQPDGRSSLEHLHDLIADREKSSAQVRREYYALADSVGIKNKVFSFMLLMSGRQDVMVMDRIQINTLWDTGRYGRLMYDDVALMFDSGQGVARYEALERSLGQRIEELYKRLGRPKDASIGRYHWESWVLNSGQVVAHPTMEGMINEVQGKEAPYANLGAPEGRYHQYSYGARYGKDSDGVATIWYTNSVGTEYKFDTGEYKKFIEQVKKPSNGVVPKGFNVSQYRDMGYPWYEAETVNRKALDELIEKHAKGQTGAAPEDAGPAEKTE